MSSGRMPIEGESAAANAVLFMVFNRPETTRQVFAAIRAARPTRLYVAADGPRPDRAGEAEAVDEVRAIATAVDWPCELRTLFRTENLGCKRAPAAAIDWLFSHEEAGIILEDDCLPHSDFFAYCNWALAQYRDCKSVWHINGNNFGAPEQLWKGEAVSFCSLAQAWGWATWRDRWQHYESNVFYVSEAARKQRAQWRLSRLARVNKTAHLKALRAGLDTWDYQWQCTVLDHRGLCLTSRSSLISNIGDGPDATHTRIDNRMRLPTRPISSTLKAVEPIENTPLTRWYERNMGLRSARKAMHFVRRQGFVRTRLHVEKLASKALFRDTSPVIVAGVGRSGSTMLCDALAASLVEQRFGVPIDSARGRLLTSLATTYLSRLDGLARCAVPIVKTHDLYHDAAAGARCVFTYCDPLESALSVERMLRTKGRIWVEEHIYHLQGQGDPEDLLHSDVLNYAAQIASWTQVRRDNVFVVRYEDLWDRREELSDFVGFEVKLPPQRSRAAPTAPAAHNDDLFRELRALYEKI